LSRRSIKRAVTLVKAVAAALGILLAALLITAHGSEALHLYIIQYLWVAVKLVELAKLRRKRTMIIVILVDA